VYFLFFCKNEFVAGWSKVGNKKDGRGLNSVTHMSNSAPPA
jgi:hypothetical protein